MIETTTSEPTDSASVLTMPTILAWLEQARELHRTRGRPLSRAERFILARYFLDDVLDSVRIDRVNEIALPPFAAALDSAGLGLPIDPRKIAGLTLVDTIVVVQPRLSAARPLMSVLFQECVHVVQYRMYGRYGFVEAYIEQWFAHGCEHDRIPFEQIADDLRMRFEQTPVPFDVEAAVAAALPAPKGQP
jgi:hypothetical protein